MTNQSMIKMIKENDNMKNWDIGKLYFILSSFWFGHWEIVFYSFVIRIWTLGNCILFLCHSDLDIGKLYFIPLSFGLGH